MANTDNVRIGNSSKRKAEDQGNSLARVTKAIKAEENDAVPERNKSEASLKGEQEEDFNDLQIQQNVRKALVDLDVACTEGYLVDLHSHLMGMGDATFWTNLMCDYIPTTVQCPPTLNEQDRTDKKIDKALKESLKQIKFCNELDKEKGNTKSWMDRVILELDGKKERKCTQPKSNNPSEYKIALPDEDISQWRNSFTDDVIYSLDALDVAFDFRTNRRDSETHEEKERRIIDALHQLVPLRYGNNTKPISLNTRYFVFNARKRSFEYVKGVPNTLFAYALFKSREAIHSTQAFRANSLYSSHPGIFETQKAAFCRALLNDSFELCGRNGNKSTPVDLLTTRGSFTPQFYPRRFILKDCMYQSKLGVLTQLMNHVACYYAKSGVFYAELSLGPSDTMNPDVWYHIVQCFSASSLKSVKDEVSKEISSATTENFDDEETEDSKGKRQYTPTKERKKALYSPSKRKYDNKKLGRKPNGIYVSFLAGLPRSSKHIPSSDDAFTDKLMEDEFPNFWGEGKMMPNLYSCLEGDCTWDRKLKKPLPTMTEGLRYYLENYLVGFDVMGDELHHPLTPLSHTTVPKIAKRMNELGQSGFGVRIHALENVSSDPTERESHMRLLLDTVKWFLQNDIRKIRIGHGSQLFSEDDNDDTDAIQSIQKEFRDLLRANQIPVEINITSNHVLLPNTAGSSNNVFVMVKKMLDDKLWVFPGTDNDGIWPLQSCLEHKHHANVAHEICAMLMHPLTAGVLSKRDSAGKSALMTMIERSRKCTFWNDNFEETKNIKALPENPRWQERQKCE